MPKTYGTVTTFTSGSVLTAAQLNVASGAVNNLVVPPSVRARRNASQNFANGALTVVNFDTQVFDTDDMFAPTANFITIQTPGIYIVSGFVAVAANATGQRAAALYLNPTYTGSGDSAVIATGTAIATSNNAVAGSTESGNSVTAIYSFALNDKISLSMFQNSTVTLAISGTQSSLSAVWVGRTV